MNVDELDSFFDMLCISVEDGGWTTECNYCSVGDYRFGEESMDGVAKKLFTHFQKYHPDRLPPSGPTQAEEEAAIESIKRVGKEG